MAQVFTAQAANGSSSLFGHFEGRRRLNVYVAGAAGTATSVDAWVEEDNAAAAEQAVSGALNA